MSKQDIHTPERWAEILKRQADNTREFRFNLYRKVDIQSKKNILDIGCGTGVITADIASLTEGEVTGIDIDDKKLEYAKGEVPDRVNLMIADVLHLPFRDCTFDLVVFSIVLTHIHEQQEAVNEMARVTQENGVVLATLEPDYAGMLSYPVSKAEPVFEKFMKESGIEMYTGRKLLYFFRKAGLKTEIGLFDSLSYYEKHDSETRVEEFLKTFERTEKLLRSDGWTDQEIEDHKQSELDLIKNDLAFSFCPCFYAIGRK